MNIESTAQGAPAAKVDIGLLEQKAEHINGHA